jgi:hypothetical protein
LSSRTPGRIAPANAGVARDRLGTLCFYLHFAVMIFIVVGWLLPSRIGLFVYLAFLPAVTVQWWFNKNSCLLNNLESFLRSGSWRSTANPEEGAWLGTLAHNTLGVDPTPVQIEVFTYSVMALFWLLGFWHLLWW